MMFFVVVEMYLWFYVNCPLFISYICCLAFSLIQAQLGSISIQEFGLTQDTARIFRNGMRISKCILRKSGTVNKESVLRTYI